MSGKMEAMLDEMLDFVQTSSNKNIQCHCTKGRAAMILKKMEAHLSSFSIDFTVNKDTMVLSLQNGTTVHILENQDA